MSDCDLWDRLAPFQPGGGHRTTGGLAFTPESLGWGSRQPCHNTSASPHTPHPRTAPLRQQPLCYIQPVHPLSGHGFSERLSSADPGTSFSYLGLHLKIQSTNSSNKYKITTTLKCPETVLSTAPRCRARPASVWCEPTRHQPQASSGLNPLFKICKP